MLNVHQDMMWIIYTSLLMYLGPLLFIGTMWFFSTEREKLTGYLKFRHHVFKDLPKPT